MTTKIIEALEYALQKETEAKEHYEDMAKMAEDPETRLLCEQIAREETSHYNKLNERLIAIKLLG